MNDVEKKLQEEHDKMWPLHQINLDTLAGAVESGRDLYLLGTFGGFGGCFVEVHYDRVKAEASLKEANARGAYGWSLFKLEISKIDTTNA